tara:strand:- start:33576 stop:34829 length:1254 start_codon:yes stop_codon:yes gene_type:complete
LLKIVRSYSLKLSNYLFILLPFSLVIGPAISDISICIIGIFFILFNLNYKNIYFSSSKLIIIFIFWFLYLIICSLISDNPIHSLESSLFYWRFGIFVFAILFLINENSRVLKLFFFSLIAIFSILILDGYLQFIIGYNILGYEYSAGRLSSFFGDELKLGSYIVRLLPIFLALLFLYNIKKRFIDIFLIVTFILIFLTGERTAFFYSLIIVFFYLIVYQKKNILFFTSILLTALIISSLIYFNDKIKNRMINQTLFDFNLKGEQIYIFSKTHTAMYETSIKIFYENPIFGVGPKQFRNVCSYEKYYTKYNQYIDGCSTHPHNTYLQLMSETGLVGFIPVFLLFLFIFFYLIKYSYLLFFIKDKRNYCIFFSTLGLLLALFPFSPSGNFFNNWLSIINYLQLIFFIYFIKKIDIETIK